MCRSDSWVLGGVIGCRPCDFHNTQLARIASALLCINVQTALSLMPLGARLALSEEGAMLLVSL